MTALPPSSNLTSTGITKATFKAALNDLRTYLSGLLGDAGTQATALTALGALLNGSVVVSATGTTIGATHRGKLIDCTGTGGWTLAVDACATLGAGFPFAVRNSTSGTITINPNLSEPIDDATTLVLAPGESCLVQVNAAATGLKTVARPGPVIAAAIAAIPPVVQAWEVVAGGSGSFAAVAYLDLDIHEDVYCEWKLVIDGIRPATDNAYLQLRPLYASRSVAGAANASVRGATYGGVVGIDSQLAIAPIYPILVAAGNGTTTPIGVGNAAGEHAHCVATIGGIGSSLASGLAITALAGFVANNGTPLASNLMSAYSWDHTTGRLCDGFRIIWSAGSLTANGTYKLYGLRRA